MVILFNNYGINRIKIGEHRITDADFESYYRYEGNYGVTSSRPYGTAMIVYDVPAGTKIAWDGSYSLNAFGFALANIN